MSYKATLDKPESGVYAHDTRLGIEVELIDKIQTKNNYDFYWLAENTENNPNCSSKMDLEGEK